MGMPPMAPGMNMPMGMPMPPPGFMGPMGMTMGMGMGMDPSATGMGMGMGMNMNMPMMLPPDMPFGGMPMGPDGSFGGYAGDQYGGGGMGGGLYSQPGQQAIAGPGMATVGGQPTNAGTANAGLPASAPVTAPLPNRPPVEIPPDPTAINPSGGSTAEYHEISEQGAAAASSTDEPKLNANANATVAEDRTTSGILTGAETKHETAADGSAQAAAGEQLTTGGEAAALNSNAGAPGTGQASHEANQGNAPNNLPVSAGMPGSQAATGAAPGPYMQQPTAGGFANLPYTAGVPGPPGFFDASTAVGAMGMGRGMNAGMDMGMGMQMPGMPMGMPMNPMISAAVGNGPMNGFHQQRPFSPAAGPGLGPAQRGPPRGQGVVGAPAAPRAMREGLPNTSVRNIRGFAHSRSGSARAFSERDSASNKDSTASREGTVNG
ncbi:hypothetical protein KEM52_001271 [Ascosphaera acerosa]|nr:hypothetical protein KEM52_001271 [Ascosphaera acerosa]